MVACGAPKTQLALISTPAIFRNGEIDPFYGMPESGKATEFDILYATDRRPADEEDPENFYSKDRGHILRLGKARIQFDGKEMDWPQLRDQSISDKRVSDPILAVTEIQEFGALWSTLLWTDPNFNSEIARLPALQFTEAINEKLAVSKQKDIFIYVPGFKVVFENPLLVASEFWHYLGYDGVFLAYAWPSTPRLRAYASDLETASYTTRNFRLLLSYLATETNVQRIHILSYSAGSRIVAKALKELRLMHYEEDEAAVHGKLRIGLVIFTGADIDLELFKAYGRDRILEIPERITVYISASDTALKWSRRFFGRTRLGTVGGLTASDLRFLDKRNDIIVINVTEAESAAAGNGHAYFRNSPWISSDVLMSLKYGLAPAERGLIREKNDPIWKFPPNYVEVLKKTAIRFYSQP